MVQNLPVIVVPIEHTPPTGGSAVPLRITVETQNLITRAARLLGMSNAQFHRTVLHNAAITVIKELS